MSTDKICQILSTGSENTENIGEKLGNNLRGGEVFELISDLGGGKTTFVRGLVKGSGSNDKVASPSFTISRLYSSNKLQIHHFDFYRLNDAGLMNFELGEALLDKKSVIVIEWGDLVKEILPKNRFKVSIKKTGINKRQIELSCSAQLSYLLEGLC